jgi:hypothetical protein
MQQIPHVANEKGLLWLNDGQNAGFWFVSMGPAKISCFRPNVGSCGEGPWRKSKGKFVR